MWNVRRSQAPFPIAESLMPRLLPVAALLVAVPALHAQTSPTAKLNALVASEYSGDRAREHVAFVERYFRTPGNPGFNASIEHVRASLEAAGYVPQDRAGPKDRLVYRLERYPMAQPAWEPVNASLTIVGGTAPLLAFATNRNMLAINSWTTPPGGVEAEVVFLEKGADLASADVRGKIVYAEARDRNLYQAAVIKGGALGILTYSMPAYTQPSVHRTSIQFGSVTYDTTAKGFGIPLSFAAREGLMAARAKGPVRVRVEVESRFQQSDELALVAEVRGRTRPEERFVFSAHVQEPGANDNASGVGAEAEMARVAAVLVKQGKVDPLRTITFLWGNEIGETRRYLTQDTVRLKTVLWGTSLDMVGEDTEKTGGTFLIEKMPDPSAIWTRGDDHHTEWGGRPLTKAQMTPHWFNDYVLGRCLEQAKRTGWVVRTNPFEGGSDHTPFLEAKKPGLLFWHFTDVYYHTDGDRLDKVSARTLANTGTSALVAALGLVTADGATARAVIGETERAALARLATETKLSADSIAKGGTADEQRDIVATWALWYDGALERTAEIELGGPSAATTQAIADARKRVAAAAAQSATRLTGRPGPAPVPAR